MYTKNLDTSIDHCLLAAFVADNPDFETACCAGNASQIMSIVETEMEKNKLFTKGSKKLHDDILRKLKGKAAVSPTVGYTVLQFVWNSRMSGNGLAVLSVHK